MLDTQYWSQREMGEIFGLKSEKVLDKATKHR